MDMRRRKLETIGILLEHFVVFSEWLPIILLHVRSFAEIELYIRGDLGGGVVFQIVLEFTLGQIVISARTVPNSILIQKIGGGERRGVGEPDPGCLARFLSSMAGRL